MSNVPTMNPDLFLCLLKCELDSAPTCLRDGWLSYLQSALSSSSLDVEELEHELLLDWTSDTGSSEDLWSRWNSTAIVNKCATYSFPPADEEQAALTSGQNSVGKVYEIKAQSLLDFTTIGAADNNVGTQFVATGQLTLTADDSLAEIKWAIGTYLTAALPSNIAGYACSGDAAGIFKIVAASAEVEARCNQLPGWASKMWETDNSGGATNFYVLPAGDPGNTNEHTHSVVSIATAGTVQLSDETYAGSTNFPATLGRITYTVTPSLSTRGQLIAALAGGVGDFVLPQMEESGYATSPILVSGVSASRPAGLIRLKGL